MSTATLSRRHLGLKRGQDEPPITACRRDQALFDIERTPSGGHRSPATVAQVLAAEAACKACPILTACRAEYHRCPPTHLCILAAEVWQHGQPYDPTNWINGAEPEPPEPSDDQTQGRPCAYDACRKVFVPTRRPDQRYCEAWCRRAAYSANRYARSPRRRPTGICRYCDRPHALGILGQIFGHDWAGAECPGSNKTPAPPTP